MRRYISVAVGVLLAGLSAPLLPPTADALPVAAACAIPADRDITVTRTVYQVGKRLGVSPKVMLAGFEAGWVESRMNNLDCGDRDSLGVFQQRPSQGWGTPEQIRDVDHASSRFFTAAKSAEQQFPHLSAGLLADKVQRSCCPARYDQAAAKADAMLAEVATSVMGGPEVVLWANGTIGTYAVHADGNVHGRGQEAPGGAFTAWQQLSGGGGFAGRPSLVQMPDGTVNLYARTTSGVIMGTGNAEGPGSGFKPWQQVSPSGAMAVAGDPEVFVRPDGTIATYAVLADGSVNGMSQATPGGDFSGWQRLSGGGFTGKPSVLQAPDGRVDLYVTTTGGAIMGTGNSTGPGSGFKPWQQVSPGGALAVAGGPEVYLRSDNTIGVYAVLADGSVNGMSQSTPGDGFSGWQRLSGGGFVDSPSVIQHPDGRVDLYVRGSDWTLWGNGNKSGPGSNWGDWTRVG
jgi:hypothetical protein